jgi:hypothetical protein
MSTWSVNKLSAALGFDRRTIEKRLRDVKPLSTKKIGARIEKRYRLADACKALFAPAVRMPPHLDGDEDVSFEQLVIAQTLFPQVVTSKEFRGTLVGFARQELGLTKPQAVRVYEIATLALCRALDEAFPGKDLKFVLPDELREMGELGPEAWVAKNWPDQPPV